MAKMGKQEAAKEKVALPAEEEGEKGRQHGKEKTEDKEKDGAKPRSQGGAGKA